MKLEGDVWKGSIRPTAPGVDYYIEANDGERRSCAPRAAPGVGQREFFYRITVEGK